MSLRRIPWLIWLAAFVCTLLVFTLGASAILAEGALHPLLRRRASDTAALAFSISSTAGATATKVTIRAEDGVALNAWWLVPSQPTGRAVMVCHGVADSAYGALGYALLFLKNGYSVLVPDSRGHGESAGFVAYGVLEAKDTVQWLAWMKSHGVREPFGFGESLGGAILLQSLAQGAAFRAVVAESSYSSFEAVAKERIARIVPFPLAYLLVKEGMLYTRIKYGVNLAKARPDLALSQSHVPVLLIHGLADGETSPQNSIEIAKSNTGAITLWLVPGAKHTGAYATVTEAFEAKVLAWFKKT